MKISKKYLALLITFIFLLNLSCTFTGCKKTNDSLKEVTLCEVAHSIFYAPMYVALENGYFEDEGLAITLINGSGADNVMTSLISGDADIGFMGSESSIYVYNEGQKDYVVNFAQLTQRAGNFLVTKEKIEDFKWQDLIGKDVLGGRAGGMPQMVFEYILKQNNINPSEINIDQSVDFGNTAAAFSSGDYFATVEFEPFATALEQAEEGYVAISLGEESGYVPYTAYCAKKSYLEDNDDIILAFTKAIQSGLDYVNSHTAGEIADAIHPQFKETDLDTVTKIVERYLQQDTWKDNTIFEEASFNLLLDILESAGELSQRAPYDKLVTTSYSKEAYTE